MRWQQVTRGTRYGGRGTPYYNRGGEQRKGLLSICRQASLPRPGGWYVRVVLGQIRLRWIRVRIDIRYNPSPRGTTRLGGRDGIRLDLIKEKNTQ